MIFFCQVVQGVLGDCNTSPLLLPWIVSTLYLLRLECCPRWLSSPCSISHLGICLFIFSFYKTKLLKSETFLFKHKTLVLAQKDRTDTKERKRKEDILREIFSLKNKNKSLESAS